MLNETESCRIVQLEAENIKRLKAIQIRPTPTGLTIIGGRNSQGKSSVLDAVMMALGGKRTVPERPIREGEARAVARLDLGNLVVERTFTAKTDRLTVKGKDGVTYPSPQAMLDAMVGSLSFDPLEFARKDAKQQGEILRQVIGLDTSEMDAKRMAAFAKRTEVGRDLRSAAARLDAARWYNDAPEKEVSLADLTQEVECGQKINQENAEARAKVARFAESTELALQEHDEAQKEVVRLERLLEDAKARLALYAKAVKERCADRDAATEQARKLKDVDLAPVRQKMQSAEADNAKVRANTTHAVLADETKVLQGQLDDLSGKIERLDTEKKKATASAKYPVPGLSLDDNGGVLFGGIPLSQASDSERLRVSLAIGLALNPKLRIVLIRDGSLLDGDSLAEVAAMAEKANAQVWVERVGTQDECAVVIEDGEVATA